ncbi:amino acid adenylation domain-containing protein [Rapidithrix thailandica]|uniref:Amino acid adenylation domain-containing protein n=1 Tax=Rapidithrix thailandica TaxID=413964 RepID=A0AAW9RPX2_9BACT
MDQEVFYKLSKEEKKKYIMGLVTGMGKSPRENLVNNKQENGDKFTVFPLSDIQESFFSGRFLGKKNDYVGCHIYFEFEEFSLDTERLRQAWCTLVAYHDMLRVVILGNATQRIQEHFEIPPFQIYDLRDKTEIECNKVLERLRKRLSHKVYEPGNWPLYEIAITHLPEKRSIIHFSIDEWITDGYSMSLLLNQWHQLYTHPGYTLPPLSYSFKEYVLESKALENTQKFAEDMAYWKAMEIHNGPDLPYVKPMPVKAEGQSCYYRKRIHKTLEANHWGALKQLCVTKNITPTSLLLTVFSELLARYSHNDQFSIILTLFNRQPLHPDIDKVMGPFVSTNFFNISRNPEKDFIAKTQDNQKYLWTLLDHGTVSGIRALRESRDRRSGTHLSVPVVFTSMINKSGVAGKDSWLEKMGYSISQTPQIYLDHQVYEYNEALHLNWDVVEEAFEPGILRKMMDTYYDMLRQLAINGDLQKNGYETARTEVRHQPPSKIHFSLTPLQQSYYVSKRSGETALIYQEFEIEEMDVNRLQRAWHTVVSRHEMLHAVITKNGVFQTLEEMPSNYHIAVKDWSGLSHDEQAGNLDKERQLQTNKQFEYDQYPWFSLSVSLLENGKGVLHCCFDGIVGDGQSMGILYKELFELYQNPAKQLPVMNDSYAGYRSYVDSQRKTDRYYKANVYWENKFENIVPGPGLIAQNTGETSRHTRLGGQCDQWQVLQHKAQSHGITNDTLLFSLYALAISTLCQEEKFSLVYVDWQRSLEHEGLVGDFTSLSWVEFDRNIDNLMELMEHCGASIKQDLDTKPFSGLEMLGKLMYRGKKSLSFPVVYTNLIDQTYEHKYDKVKPGYGCSITPNVLIDNMSMADAEKLQYLWDVSALDMADAERAFRVYEKLLSFLVQTDTDWKDISIREQLGRMEEQESANDQEDTMLPLLKSLGLADKTIQSEFEAQVRKYPERIALKFEEHELNYSELNEQANQLARYLQQYGAGPEQKIVVCMERSAEMVVSILGVLKSGAAYVPLDPSLPPERLNMILEDAKPAVIITTQADSYNVRHSSCKVIRYDLEKPIIDREDPENLHPSAKGSNLAYIIYTSGTTGKPKGTLICHYNVIRLFLATRNWFHFNERDTWTLFHSFTFDFSVWEIFGALLHGGKLVVVPYVVSRSFDRFYQLLIKEQVTVLNQTPTAFRQLCRTDERSGSHQHLALRYVIFGGEALNLQHLRSWVNRHGDQQPELINMYGITETTVHVTYRRILASDLDEKESLIGIPIPDLTVHILDQNQKPVHPGEEGELYVGGLGVARAYLDRPELTAARFIPDPFLNKTGARLYRTGDLGKMLNTGEIAYLGRIDSQVKVRGFRIELEDIESAVNRHEQVSESVVVIQEADTDDPKIVAYVIAASPSGTIPQEKELRSFLRKILPEYMLPSSIIEIDELPLNHNGKLDKGRLPWRSGGQHSTPVNEPAPVVETNPNTPQQQGIMDVFKQCLAVNDLSDEDDIFDLGATSLSLILISQGIQEKFGVEVPMEIFLEKSKIGEIIAELGHDSTTTTPVSQSADSQEDTAGVLHIVRSVFQRILNNDAIQPEDDIFDLGSTSLTLIFAIEEFKNILQIEVPIEAFLTHTTLQGIAGYLEEQCQGEQTNGAQVTTTDQNDVGEIHKREIVNIPLRRKYFHEDSYVLSAPQYDFVQKEIPFTQFSEFIALLRQHRLGEACKYLYPSAGGKNAVQTYLHIKPGKVEGLNGGVYYYHPEEHQLYKVNESESLTIDIHYTENQELDKLSAFQMFLVIQLKAMTPVYMDFSQELATLEAGYMTQLLLSRQAEFGLGICPVQQVKHERIRKSLKLEEEHVVVECLQGGLVDYAAYVQDPVRYSAMQSKYEAVNTHQSADANLMEELEVRDFSKIIRIHNAKQFNPLSQEEQAVLAEKKLHLRSFENDAEKIILNSHYFPNNQLSTRASQREFDQGRISFEGLSKLLQYISKKKDSRSVPYLYPSVGNFHGIQLYLYTRKDAVENLQEGVYRYHPENHELHKVSNRLSVPLEYCHSPFNLMTCRKASFFLFLVVDTVELENMFGANAASYVYKEAGHMGQLLMDHQAECNIGLMPVGGMSFDKIKGDFHLNASQLMIHSFMGGAVQYQEKRSNEFSADTPERFNYCSLKNIDSKYKAPAFLPESNPVEVSGDTQMSDKQNYPLSYGQRSLWYMYKSAPESYAYNSGFHVNILSEIDDEKFEKALQAVVDRHDILKVRFGEENGEPFQRMHHDFKLSPQVIDAAGWTNEQVVNHIGEVYQEPFDLEKEPVIKVYLYHQSSTSHYLFLNLHHIITDYYSTSMLIQQMFDAYAIMVNGESVSAHVVDHQAPGYMEFVEWQRDMMEGGKGESMLNDWKRLLGEKVPTMKLPHDYPRPSLPVRQGDTVYFEVEKDVYEQFKVIAKQEKSTLFMTFLTAFSVLLHKYIPDDNVVLGTLATARGDSKFNNTLGYFINPIVLWLQLNKHMTFGELLGMVRTRVFDSLKNKDYPFPLLVERLQPHRNANISPLFQVTFQFLNAQIEDSYREEAKWYKNALKLKSFEMLSQEGQFDLELELMEGIHSVRGKLMFDADLFDKATVEQMSQHFIALLKQISANSGAVINELSILTDEETIRKKRLHEQIGFSL